MITLTDKDISNRAIVLLKKEAAITFKDLFYLFTPNILEIDLSSLSKEDRKQLELKADELIIGGEINVRVKFNNKY